ncbi:MAG: acyl-CoA dehydrogenase family protein [Bdellovibrionota bacterium]
MYVEEQLIFQQSVRRFAEREILPVLTSWEEARRFPSDIFAKLGANGFLGILIPEDQGGVGGDYRLAGSWCEEFGRVPSVGFTIAVNMHSLIVLPALARYGTSEAKDKFLARALEGTAIGAYAFTEPGAGSDLTQVQTKAVKDGNGYRLNGSKIFITNGARAHFVMVLAKTDASKGYDGYTTFVVDTTSPGFSVSRTLSKLGWHSSDTAELSFADVFVPDSMVLGTVGQGWHQAMSSLEWERLMLTLTAIGGSLKCLEDTIEYINVRKVFNRTVGSFDSNRERIALLWSRMQACRSYSHRCLELLLAGKRCRKEVSLNKLSACQLAIEIADFCLQLHGGYGYTTEFLPERWLRDLRLMPIGGGTAEVMARIAGREIFPKT